MKILFPINRKYSSEKKKKKNISPSIQCTFGRSLLWKKFQSQESSNSGNYFIYFSLFLLFLLPYPASCSNTIYTEYELRMKIF